MMLNRRFLFLQGVASPFFDQLANALINIPVYKIHFCGGDVFFWRQKFCWHFSAPLAELTNFLQQKWSEYSFTDIVLFGDQRPIHRPAIMLAKQYQARIWVFEEGYLRPDWLTLELGGVNANSTLPKQANFYRQLALQLPDISTALDSGYSVYWRLILDMQYHIARYLYQHQFSHYQLHRPQTPLREYYGWMSHFIPQKTWLCYEANQLIQRLISQSQPIYLLPLQLAFDAQIVYHSEFANLRDLIQFVIHSFATFATKNARLIIKNHPLDIGTINYRQFIKSLIELYELKNRVFFIDGGDLKLLLPYCQGVVTVNSTVGLLALNYQVPVIVLGKAIYNFSELTFQADLNDFWNQAKKPDAELVANFMKVLIHYTQINGNFYTKKGIQMAIPHILKRFENI